MGDDTPLAVISDNPRTLSHFFRQNFSQVTNPPIDSLRETRVMSLKTRFSNLGNILDADARQEGVMVFDTPIISNLGWRLMLEAFGTQAATIDCTYDIASGQTGLRAAIERVRVEAETAVRTGKSLIFLTDEAQSATRAGITMTPIWRRRLSPTATRAGCSRASPSTNASPATKRRSRTACSRSWRRWASPSSRRTAAATTSKRSV